MRENEDLVVYRSSEHSYLIAGKINLKWHVLDTAKKEERQGEKRSLEPTGSLQAKCSGVQRYQEKEPRYPPPPEGSLRARRGQWLQLLHKVGNLIADFLDSDV